MCIFYYKIIKMKYVIFDFNGTIVDDLDISLEAINLTINKYLDRGPLDKEEYYKCITFPVKQYYENVGFDFDVLDWHEVGQYWMDYYVSNRRRCKVHEGIVDFLIKNHKLGNKNIVLSASMKEHLTQQLKELEVYQYFDEIIGLDNIYAHSKLENGLAFIKDKNKEDCILFGDSLHDAEVAKEMGIRCILIAKGHQNKERLLQSGCKVVDSISEVTL